MLNHPMNRSITNHSIVNGRGAVYWLETERCRLRRFTADDRDWLRELYADADVTRYLGGVKTAAQADDLLETRILDYYDANPGLGIWMTVERSTATRLGFHLLNHIQGESIIQVGYSLTKPAWGRGIGNRDGVGGPALRLCRSRSAAHCRDGQPGQPGVAARAAEDWPRRRGERAFPHPAYAAEGPMAWFEGEREEWLKKRKE